MANAEVTRSDNVRLDEKKMENYLIGKKFAILIQKEMTEGDVAGFVSDRYCVIIKNHMVHYYEMTNSRGKLNSKPYPYCNVGVVINGKFISDTYRAMEIFEYDKNSSDFGEYVKNYNLDIEFLNGNDIDDKIESKFYQIMVEKIKEHFPKNLPNNADKKGKFKFEDNESLIKSNLIQGRKVGFYPNCEKLWEKGKGLVYECYFNNKIDELATEIFEEDMKNMEDYVFAYSLTYEIMIDMVFRTLVDKINVEKEKEKTKRYKKYLDKMKANYNDCPNINSYNFVYDTKPIVKALENEIPIETAKRLSGERNRLDNIKHAIKQLNLVGEYTVIVPVEDIDFSNLYNPFHYTDIDKYLKKSGIQIVGLTEMDNLRKVFVNANNIKTITYRKKDILER